MSSTLWTRLRTSTPYVLAGAWIALGVAWSSAPPGLELSALPNGEKGSVGAWYLGVLQPGPWMVATGLLCVALAAVAAVSPARLRKWAGLCAWIFVCAVALWSLNTQVSRGKSAVIEGVGSGGTAERVSWLDDDMMISLRYAWNLAHGHGLVWNKGERVEGYTNLLWTLVLSAAHGFADEANVSRIVIGMNAVVLLALLAATFVLVRKLQGSVVAATLAGLALATSSAVIHWTAGGGEGPLVALLLVCMSIVVIDSDAQHLSGSPSTVTHGWRRWFAGLSLAGWLGGLAVLTRPDALVPVAAVLGCAILDRASSTSPMLEMADRGWRRSKLEPWTALATLAVLPLIQLAFRLCYYGEWMPNTWYLKSTRWPGRSFAGLHYVVDLLSQHGVYVILAAAACIGARRTHAGRLLFAIAGTLIYVVGAGGDELPEQRFLVPIAPWLFALGFVGAESVARRIDGNSNAAARRPSHGEEVRSPAPTLALCGLLAVGGFGGGLLPWSFSPAAARRADGEAANVRIGYALRWNTNADATVAHFWAGAAAYFSQRRAIDFYGKCDPYVARLPAHPGLMAPGHNKYDLDHSLRKEPDVIVSGLGGLAYTSKSERRISTYVMENLATPYRAFGELQSNEMFLDAYQPNLVREIQGWTGRNAEVSLKFHGVFVRTGSTRARPATEWSIPR